MENRYFKSERSFLTGIFAIGFVVLMFELIQVRMFSFFLGSISNFLAIPIALFGLSIGSLYCHYAFKGDKYRLVTIGTTLVFPAMLCSLIAFFIISNTYFDQIHAARQLPGRELSKLIIYSSLFMPPYVLFGMLLAAYFSIGSKRIGQLYFFDLAGAALGCLATPILFTYTNLRPVLLTSLFVSLCLALIPTFRFKKILIAGYGIIFVAATILAYQGIILTEYPDAKILSRTLLKGHRKDHVEELAVRWNELTRTSLVKRTRQITPTNEIDSFVVIQDDGKSNVWLKEYEANPNRNHLMATRFAHSAPYHLEMNPQKILVMFAGTGRDMVLFDTLSNRTADITGVEINRSVVEFTDHPSIRNLNLQQFFKRENIRLLVQEGRDFLNNQTEKYDFIFAATNGAVAANRIGHTRKYLDTYQAMESYLKLLADDGLIVFYNQPVEEKILSFKKLLHKRGIKDFKKTIEAFGPRGTHTIQTLMVKPSGFTEFDHETVKNQHLKKNPRLITYLSAYERGRRDFEDLAAMPLEEIDAHLVVDDEPFTRKINVETFTLFPSLKQLNMPIFASDWIKIFTVIIFATIALLVILAARFIGSKSKRLPILWLLYFFVSGVAYMCVEIGLIAKSELFMGNPLYAIAAILALFLLSNSLGAIAQDRYKLMRGPLTMAGYTTVSVIWGIAAVTLCNTYLLSIPIVLKILVVGVAVFPTGICLGTFFPYGVATLTNTKYADTVPVCYAISTLSSVLGSAFAMTAITNMGFSAIIVWGGVGYLLAAAVFLAARKFAV